ncbi:MAG: hypothetical protein ABWZ77_00910 [Naasia sp.]
MSERSDWEPPTGWVRLSDRRWSHWLREPSTVASIMVTSVVYFLVVSAVDSLPILEPLPSWGRLLVTAIPGLALSAGVLLLLHRLSPQPLIDYERDRVRIGRRTVEMRELDRATLFAIDDKRGTKRTATLVIEGGKAKFGVVLHEGSKSLEPEFRQRLSELLRRSSVAVPVSKDDPTGRFARYNFPGSLSKEEAIAVALDPPGPGDPLPILGGTPVPDRLRRTD